MSQIINGRTYRKVLTTNDQKPTGQGEPVKLNQITTNAPDKEAEEKGRPKGVIPFAIPPDPNAPPPKGDGFSKMITTHDEPKPKFRIEIDENAGPGVAKWMDDAFNADLQSIRDRDVEDHIKDKVEVELGKPVEIEMTLHGPIPLPDEGARKIPNLEARKKRAGRPKKNE